MCSNHPLQRQQNGASKRYKNSPHSGRWRGRLSGDCTIRNLQSRTFTFSSKVSCISTHRVGVSLLRNTASTPQHTHRRMGTCTALQPLPLSEHTICPDSNVGCVGQGVCSRQMQPLRISSLHTLDIHRPILWVVDIPKHRALALDSQSTIKRKKSRQLDKSSKKVIFVRLCRE